MTRRRACAVCGRALPRGKGLEVSVWKEEGLSATVCSAACRDAYEAGAVGSVAPPPPPKGTPTRATRLAAAVVAATALVEGFRAAAGSFMTDPLAMTVPWPLQASTAALLAVVAAALLVGRRGSRETALVVSVVVAVAHAVAVGGFSDARPLLVPASLTVPLFLLLVGDPGPARTAVAVSTALLLPAFVGWRGATALAERSRSIGRIEAVSSPGPTAGGAPGSVRATLPPGWRALDRNNGIVDWPHSELELIHPSSGGAAFVVLNPDCDVDALPDLQARSIDALAEAGADPIVTDLGRLPGTDIVELRVELLRHGTRLRSYQIFRAFEGEPGARPGCVWLHCLPPLRDLERRRDDCRAIARSLERVPEA